METTLERPETEDAIDSAKRRQIIDGARQVFLAQGFDGASMGEIARPKARSTSISRTRKSCSARW
jgi:hypothetical protein